MPRIRWLSGAEHTRDGQARWACPAAPATGEPFAFSAAPPIVRVARPRGRGASGSGENCWRYRGAQGPVWRGQAVPASGGRCLAFADGALGVSGFAPGLGGRMASFLAGGQVPAIPSFHHPQMDKRRNVRSHQEATRSSGERRAGSRALNGGEDRAMELDRGVPPEDLIAVGGSRA
jgi:hypothetical protein